MLTLSRFEALARSYGADLGRWPEGVRAKAQALLEASPRARAIRDEEQALDDALSAARAAETADQDAALARLRAGVAGRLVQPSLERPPSRWRGRASHAGGRASRPAGVGAAVAWPDLRWAGIAGAASLAVAAGLALGVAYSPAPPSDGVMNMLQTAPFASASD